MKTIIIAVLTFSILSSCVNSHTSSSAAKRDSSYLITAKDSGNVSYLITAIDSINNWYTIYAAKKDSVYKIVVPKERENRACKKTITVGASYKLLLMSRRGPFDPINYLDVSCYGYDDKTTICIDVKQGIYDLYHTYSIRGLCYVEWQL